MQWCKWGRLNNGELCQLEMSESEAASFLGTELVSKVKKDLPLSVTYDANVGFSDTYRQGIIAVRPPGIKQGT